MLVGLRIVTPPAGSVVSVQEAKEHLRVAGDDENDLIQSMIDAAVGYLDGPDGVLGRALAPQTIEVVFEGHGPHRLPLEPVQEAVSVTEGGITTITFTAGYPDGVPAPIRHAILLHVGELYANREMSAEKWQPTRAYERLLAPYRRWV